MSLEEQLPKRLALVRDMVASMTSEARVELEHEPHGDERSIWSRTVGDVKRTVWVSPALLDDEFVLSTFIGEYLPDDCWEGKSVGCDFYVRSLIQTFLIEWGPRSAERNPHMDRHSALANWDAVQNYFTDLVTLLREAQAEAARESAGNEFHSGRALAYYEVLSLMQTQADSFRLRRRDLSLEGFDPLNDLLPDD